jgi:hypothetical protein
LARPYLERKEGRKEERKEGRKEGRKQKMLLRIL